MGAIREGGQDLTVGGGFDAFAGWTALALAAAFLYRAVDIRLFAIRYPGARFGPPQIGLAGFRA